jgi:hypothetical protein
MTKYCGTPEQQYNVVIESRQYRDPATVTMSISPDSSWLGFGAAYA